MRMRMPRIRIRIHISTLITQIMRKGSISISIPRRRAHMLDLDHIFVTLGIDSQAATCESQLIHTHTHTHTCTTTKLAMSAL